MTTAGRLRREGRIVPARSAHGGFLLAELLPAMAASLLVFAALCSVFVSIDKGIVSEDIGRRGRQTLEASVFRMLGDLRSAGCNPWGISSFAGFVPDPAGGERGSAVRVAFDRRGSQGGSFPDGDLDDPDELVLYEWDEGTGVLRRNTQPMAVGVVRNRDGRPMFEWQRAGEHVLLSVTITLEAAGRQGRMSLTTKVWLRNAQSM